MRCFDIGFLSAAQECGIPSHEASRILKLAYDQPEVSQLFKSLPEAEDDEEQQASSTDLESLKEMLTQDLIARHISAAKHKIQL